jgi:membrane-associated protease RseP (regulator of RpoE activity)
MKPKTCHLCHLSMVFCSVLLTLDPLLRADEPQAEAVQPAETGSARAALQGVVTTDLNDLVWLRVAGQRDSLLGIHVKPVDEVLRSHLGLGEGKGFVVAAVADESPAAKAGVTKNDILLTVAGKEISGLEMLSQTLRESSDKAVMLGIIREGKRLSYEMKPEYLQTGRLDSFMVQQAEEPKYRLGVGLADADETLRSQLSLLGGEGLVVTSVETDSPASKAGVLVNDVLIKLDGKALTSIDALSEQLQAIGDKAVHLELLRRGKPATLTVTPEKKTPAVPTFLVRSSLNSADAELLFVNSVPLAADSENVTYFNVGNATNSVGVIFEAAKPDSQRQVAEMLQQVKQLQASLEALEASIKAQSQPVETNEKK